MVSLFLLQSVCVLTLTFLQAMSLPHWLLNTPPNLEQCQDLTGEEIRIFYGKEGRAAWSGCVGAGDQQHLVLAGGHMWAGNSGIQRPACARAPTKPDCFKLRLDLRNFSFPIT